MSSQRPRRSTARTRLPPASVSSKSITVPKAGAAASAASRSRPAPGASWPCADRPAPTTMAARQPRSRRRRTAEPSVLCEIGFRLGERLLRHLRGKVKLAEERADRHHLVLHRNVLLARIVALGGQLHRRDRGLALALGESQPRGRRFLLDPGLAGPVFV